MTATEIRDLTLELLILAGSAPCHCLDDVRCRRCVVVECGERVLGVG